jgi:hypothetical protein
LALVFIAIVFLKKLLTITTTTTIIIVILFFSLQGLQTQPHGSTTPEGVWRPQARVRRDPSVRVRTQHAVLQTQASGSAALGARTCRPARLDLQPSVGLVLALRTWQPQHQVSTLLGMQPTMPHQNLH